MTPAKLQEIVCFRKDKLFEGAVDIEWFLENREKTCGAASAFVFHGPDYHGVSQNEIGIDHGHKLVDTASFTLNILRRCNGIEDQPFTLAIAGYGTGKSHLAITLATLLNEPESKEAQVILDNLTSTNESLAKNIRIALKSIGGPSMILALNGMGNFDLASEFMRQIMVQLHSRGIDASAIDDLRPRFKMAMNLLIFVPDEECAVLAADCNVSAKPDILELLSQHDEFVYEKVHKFFSQKGIPIRAIGDESIKDVLETVCREYCGDDKPFKKIVILFDEFGRYAEFATMRSQIAGSGVLQHLFEGVQSSAGKAIFVGFIQFDLNTYVQRMGQEFKNEILRVSTRYQSADKVYLSINIETLIANLIEKRNTSLLSDFFDLDAAKNKSEEISLSIRRWFPRAGNHHLWSNRDVFHQVIRKGCWPLSPFTLWFLFHLAAEGRHLQQRSALSLLGDTFEKFHEQELSDLNWEISAVDLWSEALQAELVAAEESGSLGTIAHSYSSVMARTGHQFLKDEIRLLQSIVIASKMGMTAADRNDAVKALSVLSGMSPFVAENSINKLENEYNVISWDLSVRQFEILGDAVSRPQFLHFLRQRVASSYDEKVKSQLFVRTAKDWGKDIFVDQVCPFGEQHKISTNEWRFEHSVTRIEELQQVITAAVQNWNSALAVDAPRGSIIYCYVEPDRDLARIQKDISKFLKEQAAIHNVKAIPVLIVLLNDENGLVGQYVAELAVLDGGIDENDRLRFGNLIGAHKQKCTNLLTSQIEIMIKQRLFITPFGDQLLSQRLGSVCSEIFEKIYPKVVEFPFDGFSTAKGNAADTCLTLTSELLNGVLDYQSIIGKPVKDKNRAIEVLQKSWDIFQKTGDVSRKPINSNIREIVQLWESDIKERADLNIGEAIKKICRPPYGANIASASLLFGVFFRPRIKNFSILFNGETTDFSQLINEGIFKGKFLDLNKLNNIKLVPVSEEAGSEWDAMLDEWEQASELSYKEQLNGLEKALALKKRLSLPSILKYRYEHLESKTKDAYHKFLDYQKREDSDSSLMERGIERMDVRQLSFGAARLHKLKEEMRRDPKCDDETIEKLESKIDVSRQRIIQIFDAWLSNQMPSGRTTQAVSTFEREMIYETGGNLKKLKLDDLFDKIEKYVGAIVKKINDVAEAHELISKVGNWIIEHEPSRIVRIAELRDLREKAKEFSQKLLSTNKRIPIPELEASRHKLIEFVEKNQNQEKSIKKRAGKLWDSEFNTTKLEDFLQEIRELETIYEGCDSDLNDLRIMRKAIVFYKDAYNTLSSNQLSELEFSEMVTDFIKKGEELLSEDEPPWVPEDTINQIYEEIKDNRKSLGDKWLEGVEVQIEKLNLASAEQINTVYNRLHNAPIILTNNQRKKVSEYVKRIEDILSHQKVDWLVTKYNELEEKSKNDFLHQIGVKEKKLSNQIIEGKSSYMPNLNK